MFRFVCSLVVTAVLLYASAVAEMESETHSHSAIPPCHAEAFATDEGATLPNCDGSGFYAPKQCDDEHVACWCVTRCGQPIPETKGGPNIKCEEDDPPCWKEVNDQSSVGSPMRPRIGGYKPRCHDDGFYHHTQCFGSVCWCTDRCGNEIAESKHRIGTPGVCECLGEDYAWNCRANPCETSSCPGAHSDSVCKPSMCGGCLAKYYLADEEVTCDSTELNIPTVCTDNKGKEHGEGSSWKVDKCMECSCSGGVAACMTPMCMGPSMGWDHCSVKPEDKEKCCPRYNCRGCMDDSWIHRDVGDEWTSIADPCQVCSCLDNEKVTCRKVRCPGVNRYIPPLCEWVVLPEACCPRGDGPDSVVCHQPINDCQAGQAVTAECPSHLCNQATCPNHPSATCKISHCGVCHTVFYDSDGAEVDCGNEPHSYEPVCEGFIVACIVSPCHSRSVSSENPEAPTCFTDYCHPCTSLYFDSKNKRLDYNPYLEPEPRCDGVHTVGEVWDRDCVTCTCTEGMTVVCRAKECSVPDEPLPNGRCYWAKRTADECCPSRVVCEEAISECAVGYTIARSCPAEVCDATCGGHPGASCRISRCGGCSAKFYDENDQPLVCEGEEIGVRPECQKERYMTCLVSPCLTGACPSQPDLLCHLDYCQHCQAVFHDANNNKVSCNPDLDEDVVVCEDLYGNKRSVGESWPQGCTVCNCGEDGRTTCVEKNCEAAMCDETHHVGDVWADGCKVCQCSTSLTPVCRMKECSVPDEPLPNDRCYWAKRTADECCPSKVVCEEAIADCPAYSTVADYCLAEVCNATCGGHPGASCRISRCGGCSAKFYDENDQPLICEPEPEEFRPECTEPVYTCIVAPCSIHSLCETEPQAVCRSRYCQPCDPVYYDANNRKLDCTAPEKEDVSGCFDGEGRTRGPGETWQEGCQDCVCEQTTGQPACKPSKCALTEERSLPLLCHIVTDQTADECCPYRMVCYEALSRCPEFGTVATTCPDDLCEGAVCEGHPAAICRISRCGGCSVRFYDENGESIPHCEGPPVAGSVTCSPDENVRTCIVSPCETTMCDARPEATCHVGICQPCTAVFYDKENNPVDCALLPEPQPECDPRTYLQTPEGATTLPRCLWNGHFAPKQCDTSGQCWCADPDGTRAAYQPDVVPGKEFVCELAPPCRTMRKSQGLVKEQEMGPDPSSLVPYPDCDAAGWFEPQQCCPVSGKCWCSQRDGTTVPGSHRPQGEPLHCNLFCQGDIDMIYAGQQCTDRSNTCPGDSFCHVLPNHTSGKCCRFPDMSPIP